MLRIHFTADDLARVRIAGGPDLMWETVLSFHRLRDRHGAFAFDEWRKQARGRPVPEAGLLSKLIAPRRCLAGSLLDGGGPRRPGPEAGGGVVAVLGERPELPSWMHPLCGGDAELLNRLAAALHAYHRAVVAPLWPRVEARIEADRAVRARALLDGGTERLLSGLGERFRWSPPVLEADHPADRQLRLDGRGLLLQPSYFCWRTPIAFPGPGLVPTLLYPVGHERPGPGAGPRRLALLLGGTRAAVLEAVGSGRTTTELARRTGVSLASASHHAGILREAGLVLTLRHRNSVLHTLTPLGTALLRCEEPGGDRAREPERHRSGNPGHP